MVIIIKKDTTAEEIKEALKKLPKRETKSLASFYGKLKGAFGVGLAYQKAIRDDWN